MIARACAMSHDLGSRRDTSLARLDYAIVSRELGSRATSMLLRGPVHVALPAEPAALPVLLAAAA